MVDNSLCDIQSSILVSWFCALDGVHDLYDWLSILHIFTVRLMLLVSIDLISHHVLLFFFILEYFWVENWSNSVFCFPFQMVFVQDFVRQNGKNVFVEDNIARDKSVIVGQLYDFVSILCGRVS